MNPVGTPEPDDQASPVSIGPGMASDIAEVEALERMWAQEGITPNPYQPTERVELLKHGYLLIARTRHRMIGHLTADELTEDGSSAYPMGLFSPGSRLVHIEGMYVLPAWRRHGVGSRLLRTLFDEARKGGVRQFRLTAVHRTMPPLIRFYLAQGFITLGEPGRFGEIGMSRVD